MFIALIKGELIGCIANHDIIDCNKTWHVLKAKNWNDARDEVKEILDRNHKQFDKDGRMHWSAVDTVQILDVIGEEEFDVEAWENGGSWKK